jgi:predicted AAA+ superfamily ATPase
MDAFRRRGDSLMGRYFLYRMHPFSVAEAIRQDLPDPERVVRPPARISADDFHALWTHGGFPEPFLKRDPRFTRRWQSSRLELLLREEIRDLTQIYRIDQIEMLVRLLADRSGGQLVYSNLARDLGVAVDTAKRWVNALACLHHGFLVKPWFRNVSRALRKEPKWFLRDWAGIEDPGRRAETFVACHLLKAVEGWTDLGFGRFELAYLRDKERREVDFLVVRDAKPRFLVEVKYREEALADALGRFQAHLRAPLAFQVVIEADFVSADCFARPRGPVRVPAATFLSQLL